MVEGTFLSGTAPAGGASAAGEGLAAAVPRAVLQDRMAALLTPAARQEEALTAARLLRDRREAQALLWGLQEDTSR